MIYLGAYKIGETVPWALFFHDDMGQRADPADPAARLRSPVGTWTDAATPAKLDGRTGLYGGTIDTTGFAAGLYLLAVTGTVPYNKSVGAVVAFHAITNTEEDLVARLGAATVNVSAPVAASGTLTLRQGDDYSAEYDRAVIFAVDDAAHKLKLDAEGVVVRLKATQATWTATGVTSTADGYLIAFEPTAADTRALTIARQPYEIEAKLADGDVVTLTVGTLVCERDIPAVT